MLYHSFIVVGGGGGGGQKALMSGLSGCNLIIFACNTYPTIGALTL